MKRLATYAQHKILRYYWNEGKPFTVNDLVRKKVLHFPALGMLTLRLMESRGQVMLYGKLNGEILYIATTESKDEWAAIWINIINSMPISPFFGIPLHGRNRYEKQALIAELEDIIETYRKADPIT